MSGVQTPDGVRLRFTLPSGAYATTLLREVMKVDLPEE
ncbi:MAG: tRNA pseudouridine(13) synthase TruD [Planctomycetaceae bacterium]|nr:tRNA pseudouridine(13) synthase TruD [Planctomycetaceae bacterium]